MTPEQFAKFLNMCSALCLDDSADSSRMLKAYEATHSAISIGLDWEGPVEWILQDDPEH